MKKFLFSASVLVAMTLMFVVTSCMNMPEEQTPTFSTFTTKRTTETITMKFTAKLKGVQDVTILPRISGNITRISTKEGAVVRKGETLFVIDQRPYELQVKTCEANVLSMKAQLSTAKLNLESNEGLFNKKIISRYAYETAQNNYNNAEAALELAKAQLDNAMNDLSYCTVKSPVDGIVGVIPFRVGDLVGSNMSQPLTVVSDVSKVNAYFSITEGDYIDMTHRFSNTYTDFFKKKNQGLSQLPPVKLQMNDGSIYGKDGKVVTLSGIIDELTGTMQCKAEFDNPQHILRSGISATVLYSIPEPDLMLIPQTAVNQLQDKNLVYVLQADSTVKATIVEIEEMNDGKHYIVNAGIDEGAEIVASGLNNIADGMKISVKK